MDFFQNFQTKKGILLHDMHTIHKYLEAAAQHRKAFATSWEEMGRTVKAMIVSQCPETQASMDKFEELLKEIAQCHYRLADEEMRNSEDFNDVIERYNVLYRMHQAYTAAKKKFMDAADTLDEARSDNKQAEARQDYEKRKEKLLANIEKCENYKKECVKEVITNLREFIETRTKYNDFKVRRFRSGWSRYAKSLQIESEKELAVIAKIQELLAELKSGGNVSAESVSKIEESVANNLAASPEPSFTSSVTFAENNAAGFSPDDDHFFAIPAASPASPSPAEMMMAGSFSEPLGGDDAAVNEDDPLAGQPAEQSGNVFEE